jgi:hypothetical protein
MDPEFNVYWWRHCGAVVVVPEGLLDALTYGRLRDTMVKAAADEPRAVIVEVDRLRLDSTAVLALFPAVGQELARWPGLPLLLVATDEPGLRMLTTYRMGRLLPVHRSVGAAVAAIGAPPPRRVERRTMPNGRACLPLSRAFVRQCCRRWRITGDRVVDAVWVANELVENTVKHTYGPPTVRVELRRNLLSIAVYDDDPALPAPRECPPTRVPHGLAVVARLCRAWGSTPTQAGGTVVWAAL